MPPVSSTRPRSQTPLRHANFEYHKNGSVYYQFSGWLLTHSARGGRCNSTGPIPKGVYSASFHGFMIHSQHTPSSSSGTTRTRTLLFLGFRRRDRLNNATEICFGVGELLDLLDLQAAVFVGNDVPNEDRFTDHLNPDCGTHPVGDLWGRNHTLLLGSCGKGLNV